MKKQYVSVILICLAAVLSLQLLACSDIFSPPMKYQGEKGNVTISFSAGRAPLSPTTMYFDDYVFTFFETSNPYVPAVVVTKKQTDAVGDTFSFSLEQGKTYRLEVRAFTGTYPNQIEAGFGTHAAFFVSTDGIPVYLSVNLTGQLGNGGTGTFAWDIKLPKEAMLNEMLLYIDDLNTVPLGYTEDNSGTLRVVEGSKADIPAGRYFLIVQLSKLNGETTGYANGVIIYPGQETLFEENFSTYFKDPNIENEGISVDKWFGFTVKGENLEVVMPGNPNGTLYKTSKLDLPNYFGPYHDVLMLTPPAGGYPSGSQAMTYTVPVSGSYKFSIWVYIQQNTSDPKGAYISFESTTDWERIASYMDTLQDDGDLIQAPFNTWFKIETPTSRIDYKMNKGETFGLVTRDSSSPGWNPNDLFGLNGHTVYFRDPELSIGLNIDEEWHPVITILGSNSAPNQLTIAPNNLNLYLKESEQLALSGDISGGSPVWISSNPAVATVDGKGKVTALTEGITTISATSGSLTATSAVTVTPKYIALTFDDGPDPSVTPSLLYYLKNAQGGPVHASFFLLGMRAEAHNSYVAQAFNDGHDIGNHTWNHEPESFANEESYYTEKSVAWYKDNLFRTQRAVSQAIEIETGVSGIAPRFFRPAYLDNEDNLADAAAELGVPRVGGNLLDDWVSGTSPQEISDRAIDTAKPWGILIFHDYYQGLPQYFEEGELWEGNGTYTVAAIPDIINRLRASGYEPVSLSEMLAKKNAWLKYNEDMHNSFDSIESNPSGSYTAVSDLTVSQDAIELTVNGTATVTASVAPLNATRNDVYWYTMDDNIARISSTTGNSITITGRAVGNTSVYAMTEGRMREIKVTVPGIGYTVTYTRSSYNTGSLSFVFESNVSLSTSNNNFPTITVPSESGVNTATRGSISGSNRNWTVQVTGITFKSGQTSGIVNIGMGTGSNLTQVDKTLHPVTLTMIGYTTTYTRTGTGDSAAGTLRVIFTEPVASLNAGTGSSNGIRVQKGTGWYNTSDVTVGTPTVVSDTDNKEWTMTISSSTANNIRFGTSATSATLNITTGSHTSTTHVDKTQHTQIILNE